MKAFDFNKIPNILIIVLFLIVITTFLWAPVLKIEDAYKSENRELASMPEIVWDENIFSLPSEFGSFIADQFPLRYHLIRLSHEIRHKVFHEKIYSSVIVGDNGWLYLNNQKYKDICQNVVNWGKFDHYTETINVTNQFLESRGVEYVIAFIPEKCHVYSTEVGQVLPDLARRYSTIPLIEHLSSTSDATVINLFDALTSQKALGQLYLKNDTHWNSLGAYLGYQFLVTSLLPETSSEDRIIWDYMNNYQINEWEGDLGRNTGLPEYIFEAIDQPDDSVINLYWNEDGVRVYEFPNTESRNLELIFNKGERKELIFENPGADNDLTLVVFHDSFFRLPPVSEFLATHFKRTIYLNHNWGYKWSNNPEKLEQLIDKWDPDIILVAHIERNIKMFIRE